MVKPCSAMPTTASGDATAAQVGHGMSAMYMCSLCLHLVIERYIALYMNTLVKRETVDLKTTNNYLWIESLVKNKQMNYLWI